MQLSMEASAHYEVKVFLLSHFYQDRCELNNFFCKHEALVSLSHYILRYGIKSLRFSQCVAKREENYSVT